MLRTIDLLLFTMRFCNRVNHCTNRYTVTTIIIALASVCAICLFNNLSTKFNNSFDVTIEQVYSVTNTTSPVVVVDQCVIVTNINSEYKECSTIPGNKHTDLRNCAKTGGYCANWMTRNCKPCYHECDVGLQYQNVSMECKITLKEYNCKYNGPYFIGYKYSVFKCPNNLDLKTRIMCSKNVVNEYSAMKCKPRDYSCGCDRYCAYYEPNRICNVSMSKDYHFIKTMYYVIDNVSYINRNINYDCRVYDDQCINNALNNNPLKTLYGVLFNKSFIHYKEK